MTKAPPILVPDPAVIFNTPAHFFENFGLQEPADNRRIARQFHDRRAPARKVKIIRPTKRKTAAESRGAVLRYDILAGLINAVVSVPDGLASAALAGVNPGYGLYTSIAAPIVGSAIVSGQLMQIATTSASALAAGEAIASYPTAQRAPALFLLVALVGVCLAIFALLRLGRLVRFVSHAVMTGFLAGVAVLLILDQAAPFVGGAPEGRNEVAQFFDLLIHLSAFSATTIVTGVLALAILYAVGRTRFAALSSLVALVVPSLLVAVLGWGDVQRVVDVSRIPFGIPVPALPDIALLTPSLMLSAFAIAVIVAVQGAGVSQSIENPDGSDVDPSRDLAAQGAANIASSLLCGIPAGGSVSQTALNVSVGARSRLSGILGGAWMLVIVLAAPHLVEQVPMTVLAALMIMAGLSALDVREARSIWNTGGAARLSVAVTFVATLLLSIPMAVAASVLLTILLYLSSSASDVTVCALVPLGGGRFAEADPPTRLPGRAATILDVYGSLFFAGARTLGDALPKPADSRPAVVLRLRGRTKVGATLIDVLSDYADELAERDGRLYLTGVSDSVAAQLRHAGKLDVGGRVHILAADRTLGASTERALALADEWLQADGAAASLSPVEES